MARHWGAVVDYARRIVGSASAAEDIGQRTFLRLWRRRERWSEEGSLRGLLLRIARNLAISETRSEGARSRARRRAPEPRIPRRANPEERLESRELAAELERAIAGLPERRREVFVLRFLRDLSYREIAEVMGIAEQTVANQVSRALATLRDELGHLLDE